MWLKIIGIFHFLHSPLLIAYPFVFTSPFSNLLYLNYFFSIMISYTFLDGECPISYLAKLLLDSEYIAGENISHYPEMLTIFPNNKYVHHYFFTSTTVYSFLLSNTIQRLHIPLSMLVFPFSTLTMYVLFIHNIYFQRKSIFFQSIQEITKMTLCTTLFTLSISYILYPMLFLMEDRVLPCKQP